jgi:hypothetical protein
VDYSLMNHGPGSVAFLGEHGVVLAVLPWLAVALFAFLAVVQYSAVRGDQLSSRLLAGLERLLPLQKLALLLIVVSATVHLALVPVHSGDPVTALLFSLDAVALVGVGFWALLRQGWRPLAATLLAANLVAYAYYLAAGLETADAVGIATKVLEGVALVAVLIPSGMRFVSPLRERSQAGR